jgi:hypothetical protein
MKTNLLRAFAAACFILMLIALARLLRPGETAVTPAATQASTAGDADAAATPDRHYVRLSRRGSNSEPDMTAGQIVASKVMQFARNRRDIALALAAKKNMEMPDEARRFFDAIEAGNWEEANALFKSMQKRVHDEDRTEAQFAVWPVIVETYGVAEAAHEWPAQKLLDYGNAVLGSLRPGMVYVGGTDAGRFIPTLLNETSGGERHVVLTQNALADGTYLEYVRHLYSDQLVTVDSADSQRAFKDYIDDASRRLQHDLDHPDEPKQLRPGEDVKKIDNRVQVSGQVAVMSINEKILQEFMRKNPDLSFALEESSPLKSTYPGATPLGPLMELRAGEQDALTPERAAQSLDYWRQTAQQLANDPEAPPDSEARKAWAQMAMAQANLFADRDLGAQAEPIYRLASELSPGYLAPVGQLAQLFQRTGRVNEAQQLLEDFLRSHPNQRAAIEALRRQMTLAQN